MLDQKNTRKQGDVGMGVAIGWFSSQGWTVCVPLTDSQSYDLVIDFGEGLKKVQIKTTKSVSEYNKYQLTLKTCGGNRSGVGKTKLFDNKKVDFLFALTEKGDMYLIPSVKINSGHSISLGSKWDKYKVRFNEISLYKNPFF